MTWFTCQFSGKRETIHLLDQLETQDFLLPHFPHPVNDSSHAEHQYEEKSLVQGRLIYV